MNIDKIENAIMSEDLIKFIESDECHVVIISIGLFNKKYYCQLSFETKFWKKYLDLENYCDKTSKITYLNNYFDANNLKTKFIANPNNGFIFYTKFERGFHKDKLAEAAFVKYRRVHSTFFEALLSTIFNKDFNYYRRKTK